MPKQKVSIDWIEKALEFAQLSLQAEPGAYLQSITKSKATRENIPEKVRDVRRHEPSGRLVSRFVLPLDCCPRYNELLGANRGTKTSRGKRAFRWLYEQNGLSRGDLIIGRPFVRFIRFSVKDPDHDSSWTKVPQDALVNKEGKAADAYHMRYLSDDNNRAAEIHAWWEPSGALTQFVYFDLWER